MHRRIIIVTLSLLLVTVISCVILFFLRDSGPPPRVDGNLTARDISQIQQAVRHRLWHETFPNFSVQTFKTLPANIHAVLTNRVAFIGTFGSSTAYAMCGTNWIFGYSLTNGPGGWRYSGIHWQNPND
jgi:hypothetical protein